ncbi:hypothetical protein PSPO_b1667 [Pseudoalteromonas spongiae UST010723-006]|nr:hypothetical protein PSPO_b1667 [Pseudoalteromonas spongiae UST010723-006]
MEDWHVKHFEHLTPTVISDFNGKPVIKINELKAWYTDNKPTKSTEKINGL